MSLQSERDLKGALRLYEETDKDSPDHARVYVLYQRLKESVERAIYGDTRDNRAERTEVMSELNRVTERLFDISFDDYCQSKGPHGKDRSRGAPGSVHLLSAADIQVNFHTSIIPTAYCNQLSAQDYPLVQIIIDNSHPASIDTSLSISAFIEDYSDLAQESVLVAKGLRKEFALLPVLKQSALATLNDMRKVTLHYSVKQTAPETRILQEDTKQLHLMARNRALIGIRDENQAVQDLTKYLAAWVTPNRSEIAIVQRQAIRYAPKAFVGYQEGSAESLRDQALALFSALKYAGLAYVNSVFNWEVQSGYITQKVRLPRECLAEGMCANCLDSAVLFASLLELSGIAPVLVLIPGHAFVGWRIEPEGKQYEFLDTSIIGTDDFEQAQRAARQLYEQARAAGDFERILFHNDGFARLIDVAQHKQAGIYALE